MSRHFIAAAAFVSFLTTPLFAEQRPVVVELYTSQGCSSCPPADEILSALKDRDDVIAIALHVDYWDYIGWKDPFGHPAHAERQRAFATTAGRRTIYTPEMVVNGQTDIVGAKPMALSKAIAEHAAKPQTIALDVVRDGETLRINALSKVDGGGPVEVHLLRITPEQTTEITRGENRGKSIAYTHIAHDWQIIGSWDGKSEFEMSVPVSGDDPAVVILQSPNAGPIMAAAQVD
ncbi:DUF1223 domain-containing protein [Sulfitobacter sp. SK012]|uniref:DUF1223 domain-containing protein n=1 Tax=Sulfitobacter sp. SK012 TaxID=1389005 RepID=UPI000E0C5C2A|nr:DUF1223 domain-containing protein [Sulfitobacter sp. SK012]AXI47245.1 DUF1223 domain-containing protein [Sulfitobacter sp. SK012]